VGPNRYGDRSRRRVGLLGGSFNPAHAGHLAIAEDMRRRLRLDQVWLLVSPGNPLKPRAGMAPFAARLASAAAIADGRRIVASDLEKRLGTRYSVDTSAALRRLFPRSCFVWLMGADSFAELPRWRHWREFARTVPIAVHARPGADRAALSGQAALLLRHRRLAVGSATRLACQAPPAWLFLPFAHYRYSATALRAAGLGLNVAPETDTH
jgi:nicotinate-nucleotide adenylyltransferase